MQFVKHMRLFLLLFCFGTANSFAAPTEKISQNGLSIWLSDAPEWVDQRGYDQQMDQFAADGPVSNLFYDRQLNALQDKQVYQHLIRRINNRSALESMSRLQFTYNMAFEQFYLHKLNVIREGQVVSSIKPADIQLIHREDDLAKDMVYGYATVLVLLKGTQPGDLIEYSYTIQGSNPVFGQQISAFFDMGWQVSVGEARLRVIQPKGRKFDISSGKLQQQAKITTTANGTEFSWLMKNTQRIRDNGNYPPGYLLYPYVEVTEFADWNSLARQQVALYPEVSAFPEGLQQEIQKIAALPTEQQKILAALQLAQDRIRYLGLELGINAYQPHTIDQVWQRKSGDCKDKTYLLVSILRYLGITADPALVNTSLRGGIAQYNSSPILFDHVITRVIHNGQDYWLDPTRNTQYGSLSSLGYISYGKALVLNPATTSLSDMRPAEESDNQVRVKEVFNIVDYGAPVLLHVETEYSGNYADTMRYQLAATPRHSLEDSYRNHYGKYYDSAEIYKPFQVVDDKDSNKVTIVESYILDQYLTHKDERVGVSIYAADFYNQLLKPKQTQRSDSFYLGKVRDLDHEVVIRYPKPMTFDQSVEPFELDNENFKFIVTEDYYARELHFNFKLKIKKSDVADENVKQVLSDITKARNEFYQNRTVGYDSVFDDVHIQQLFEELY